MSETPQPDPLIGQRLSEYQVLEAVASGGMGVVYRGLHPVIQKRAAIKVLKVASDNDYEQLVREAQAANAINHQNIVGIFGIGRIADGRAYVIMEYLEGRALDQYVAGRVLPQLEVVQLLFDMCAPLQAAHSAQIIHRDLKPSNVFLCDQPGGGYFLKLLDFGLAKKSMSLDGVTEQTAKATVAGTPDYMAPEQAQGKAISPRTDLYALGCMAYEMLTGRVPFTAPTPFDVMVAHVRAPAPRVSDSVKVPPELDALVHRLMSKKPDERPQSADEVRDALLPMLESLGAASIAAVSKTGPRPALSGEFVVRAARVSGIRAAERAQSAETDDALPAAPASQSGDAAPVPESDTDDALPKAPGKSYAVPILAVAGVVVVLAVALAVTSTTKEAQPLPSEEPAQAEVKKPEPLVPTAKEPEPAKVVEADVTDAGVQAPVLAEIPDTDEELDSLTPLPNGVQPKKEIRLAPTEAELKKRLVGLEQRLRKKTPAGESPDPAALQYLAKYRVQATMADTPAQRGKLSKQLDHWERLFLTR